MTLALRQMHVGDCRELLKLLPDESVNCVVTSPPYWSLRDYGTGRWEGGDRSCPHSYKPGGTARSTLSTYANGLTPDVIDRYMTASGHATYRSVCGKCGARRIDQQIGLEEDPLAYVAAIAGVFREIRRVLRSDGTLWLNLGDSYAQGGRGGIGAASTLEGGAENQNESRKAQVATRGYRGQRLPNGRGDQPAVLRKKAIGDEPLDHPRMASPGFKPKDLIGIPWRVAFALQDDGWWLRSDIIWKKPNPMPESVTDRPTKSHEYLFLLSKSAEYFYDAAAIREPQLAPDSSTPDDVARAFSRRRQTATEQRQEPLTAEAVAKRRRTSGNLARKYRQEHGGPSDRRSHQAHAVPWTDKDGMRNKRSVWTVATEPYGGAHFATFPRKLVEPCILAGCPRGGVVLDPFGGSGTVGEVAEALGRNWILFDLNPEYSKLAAKRTAQRGLFVDPGKPSPA